MFLFLLFQMSHPSRVSPIPPLNLEDIELVGGACGLSQKTPPCLQELHITEERLLGCAYPNKPETPSREIDFYTKAEIQRTTKEKLDFDFSSRAKIEETSRELEFDDQNVGVGFTRRRKASNDFVKKHFEYEHARKFSNDSEKSTTVNTILNAYNDECKNRRFSHDFEKFPADNIEIGIKNRRKFSYDLGRNTMGIRNVGIVDSSEFCSNDYEKSKNLIRSIGTVNNSNFSNDYDNSTNGIRYAGCEHRRKISNDEKSTNGIKNGGTQHIRKISNDEKSTARIANIRKFSNNQEKLITYYTNNTLNSTHRKFSDDILRRRCDNELSVNNLEAANHNSRSTSSLNEISSSDDKASTNRDYKTSRLTPLLVTSDYCSDNDIVINNSSCDINNESCLGKRFLHGSAYKDLSFNIAPGSYKTSEYLNNSSGDFQIEVPENDCKYFRNNNLSYLDGSDFLELPGSPTTNRHDYQLDPSPTTVHAKVSRSGPLLAPPPRITPDDDDFHGWLDLTDQACHFECPELLESYRALRPRDSYR